MKQHEGTHFFRTSSKWAQPLLYQMANALYQSKLLVSAFFVISHSHFFPSTLKTTKFTNFHRPHSVFRLSRPWKAYLFPPKTVQTLMSHSFSSLHCIYFEIFILFSCSENWSNKMAAGMSVILPPPPPPTLTGKCQGKSDSYFNQASQ